MYFCEKNRKKTEKKRVYLFVRETEEKNYEKNKEKEI